MNENKLKTIHERVLGLVKLLREKVEIQTSKLADVLPDESKDFTEGQLFEAQYILDEIEEIIYK